MKREIKFRVWNLQLCVMEYPQHTIYWNNLAEILIGNISEYIPMQYVEQKDKNGKELYEGDICKINNGNILVCKFQFSQFLIQDVTSNSIFNIPLYSKNFEIIGNIYENPNLLTNGI